MLTNLTNLTNLKKNHRYVFYKKPPNTNIIKKFTAIVISTDNNTLLVYSYESDEMDDCKYSNNCIWSIPLSWIVRVETIDKDIVVNHEDICVRI